MTRLRSSLLLALIFGVCLVTSEQNKEEQEETVNLTKDICLDARILQKESPLRKHCCGQHIEMDKESMECMRKLGSVIESEEDDLIVISKVAECTYKKKKFMKGAHDLNFKRIQAAANELDNPRERKFMMDMYIACEADAKRRMRILGNHKLGVRRPFYTFVYMCVSSYSETTSCPYFRWQDVKGEDEEEDGFCDELISECEEFFQEGTPEC